MRRSPLRRVSAKRKALNAALADARIFIYQRSGGFCEMWVAHPNCAGHGSEAHHILRRSQGGTDDPTNLLWLCRAGHRWIHEHPAEAREAGLLDSSAPGVVANGRPPMAETPPNRLGALSGPRGGFSEWREP